MVQKRRGLLALIGVISLFFIVGCGGGGDEISLKDTPFIGGSKGLELKFLDGAPPDEITDVSFPFQAVVSIKNVGEHDIAKNQVRVDLSGILASDFGSAAITNIQPADDPSSRKKDSEGNIIEAVETFATIPQAGSNLQLGSGKILGNTKFTFRADVCYQYETNAIGSVCVLSNMIDIDNDAICSPKGSRPISSSGSPIRVTSFRQSIVGEHKIQFSFDIAHSGTGNIFQQELAATGCPKDASSKRTRENRVKVTVNTGISGTLTCVGIGTGTGSVSSNVVLSDGKRTITCTQDVPASDFERNVDIKLEFNYHDSIDKEVLAKKLGTTTTVSPPPPGGAQLPECGVSSTKCMPQQCSNFRSNFQQCDDASLICRCATPGYYPCAGVCTSVTDLIGPIVGGIEPRFAKSDTSIVFVIYDVYDAESGVNSCKFKSGTISEVTNEYSGAKQGSVNCDQAANDCDFWTIITVPKSNIKIDAICTNKAGITNKDNDPTSSLVTVLDTPPTDPDSEDTTLPQIGSVITNVGLKDQEMMLLAIGIQDKESGIKKCDLFVPGQQPGDAILVVGETTIRGVRKPMQLQGPTPCMSTEKGVGHGPCSAYVQHTFTTAGALPSYIECENGKNLKHIVNVLTNILHP